MRPQENYTPFIAVAFGLTLAILASFQLYIAREPTRIAADEQRDTLIAISKGRELYAQNCALCHGENGEGVDGPPLNDKTFLNDTLDNTIFSVISSGVPGSEMPAWSQAHGGPFTDQQIRELVAFIRSWQPDAPDRRAAALAGDPINGLTIYNSTCIVCHGANGQGTETAPALNDPERLAQFDDEWYADTIAEGRPAQGMPTWGTVLSPAQINDLIALLRAWQRGETIEPPGVVEVLKEARHTLEEGDVHGAEHALGKAQEGASAEVLALVNQALTALEEGDQAAALDAIEQAIQAAGGAAEDGGGEHDDAGGEHDQMPAPDTGGQEHDDGGGEHDQSPPPDTGGQEHDDGGGEHDG